MKGWKRKSALGLFVAGVGCFALGRFGMVGNNVRAVDVLAIFSAGFVCGIAFLLVLQSWRDKPAPDAPTKSKGSG
jgi:hypothetical protein